MFWYLSEDYQDNTFGIPDEYKHETGGYVNDYVDINDYFGKIPIIKKYREELIKRGVVLRSTILDNNKENDDDNKTVVKKGDVEEVLAVNRKEVSQGEENDINKNENEQERLESLKE